MTASALSQDYTPRLEAPLRDRWTDVFRADRWIHLALFASITGGVFQGYLKDRIAGPLPYAIADGFFVLAVVLWMGTLVIRRDKISGPGMIPIVLLIMVLVPAVYLAAPGTPLLVKLAGLRTWSIFPVGCLMGLYVIRTTGQVRAYLGIIATLCIVAAAYGIWQYMVGPDDVITTQLAELRHGNTIYYGDSGNRGFRAFSTFTFPAPFAGFMVFGILIVAGRFIGSKRQRLPTIILPLLGLLFFAGMTVSGTRAALLTLVLGLGIIGWLSGVSWKQLIFLPVGVAAVHVATLLTAGGALDRFASVLLQEGLLWDRIVPPIVIAGRAISENVFGLGLGRSGVGVPFQVFQAQPTGFFVGSDGDLGRAAVELGVVGIALLALVVVAVVPHAMRAARELMDSDSRDVGLAVGGIIVATGILIMIGSPLTTAPHGTIWWFLTGGLLKLSAIQRHNKMVEGTKP